MHKNRHQFVKVSDHWIKFCSLMQTWTYNRHAKFWLRILSHWKKIWRNLRGAKIILQTFQEITERTLCLGVDDHGTRWLTVFRHRRKSWAGLVTVFWYLLFCLHRYASVAKRRWWLSEEMNGVWSRGSQTKRKTKEDLDRGCGKRLSSM